MFRSSNGRASFAFFASFTVVGAAAACTAGCHDVDRWSTGGGRFEGAVVSAEFVRSGVAAGTKLCLTFDSARLGDAPGTLSTSDGRFRRVTLAPVSALTHDPLSTLSFGSGRAKNFIFSARGGSDAGSEDAFVVVSLMESGDAEVRLMRPPSTDQPSGVFGVFPLERAQGPCSFGGS